MTPRQIELVRASFGTVLTDAGAAAGDFYDRLFAIAPAARPLFPDDMAEQKSKLMLTLGTLVDGLGNSELIAPVIRELGRRHADYGALPAHYAPVGQALIAMLRARLGAAFDSESEAAWTEAYGLITRLMLEGAAEEDAGHA